MTSSLSQHLDVHIADLDSEYTPLLHGFKENARYEVLRRQAFSDSTWFGEMAKHEAWQQLLEKIWRMTGFGKMNPKKHSAVDRIQHFQSLAQQIGIERAHKMAIFANDTGETLDVDDEQRVRDAADHACRLRYQGNSPEEQIEMARLAAGMLPAEIMRTLEDVVHGRTERRISVYSAHDNTIMALLAHVGLRDWEIPQAACG